MHLKCILPLQIIILFQRGNNTFFLKRKKDNTRTILDKTVTNYQSKMNLNINFDNKAHYKLLRCIIFRL